MVAPRYHGYRFPPEIISHAVWLYYRFSLSFRDVEDLLTLGAGLDAAAVDEAVVHGVADAGKAVGGVYGLADAAYRLRRDAIGCPEQA